MVFDDSYQQFNVNIFRVTSSGLPGSVLFKLPMTLGQIQ
jgi:hypothetical protein